MGFLKIVYLGLRGYEDQICHLKNYLLKTILCRLNQVENLAQCWEKKKAIS